MNDAILKAFPGTDYHAEIRLLTWHPRGLLDDDLADRIVAFLEWGERITGTSFNRYTDLSGLSEIRLKVGHIFRVVARRSLEFGGHERVKSAFFSDSVVGFGVARLYETLMVGTSIEVRAFRSREDAAEWLGVPVASLLQDPVR